MGMIRMQDTFMEGYKGYADPLLDLPAARDTRRMRALETEVRGEVEKEEGWEERGGKGRENSDEFTFLPP